MDRLILLRHGKAEPDSDSGDDFDRRLAPRGVRESVDMGARLADMGFQPQVALVSPAARARDTWEAAQPAFPAAETRFVDHLYHADSETIRHAAEEAGALHRRLDAAEELAHELLEVVRAQTRQIERLERVVAEKGFLAFWRRAWRALRGG